MNGLHINACRSIVLLAGAVCLAGCASNPSATRPSSRLFPPFLYGAPIPTNRPVPFLTEESASIDQPSSDDVIQLTSYTADDLRVDGEGAEDEILLSASESPSDEPSADLIALDGETDAETEDGVDPIAIGLDADEEDEIEPVGHAHKAKKAEKAAQKGMVEHLMDGSMLTLKKAPKKPDCERVAMEQTGVIKKKKRARWGDMAVNNPCFPRELKMSSHPLYVVEPPDVLYIEALQLLPNRPVAGERLVRQDGTISLGYYGQLHVSGLTLAEIEDKIRSRLADYVNDPQVYVDVAAFNSKVYYVLGQVQQTGRLPITGKETVLDAVTLAGGLTNYAQKQRIHVARPNPGGGCDQILHVDWFALTHAGDTRTNYQLLPGDRVMVPGTPGYRVLVFFDSFLSPLERVANILVLGRFLQR